MGDSPLRAGARVECEAERLPESRPAALDSAVVPRIVPLSATKSSVALPLISTSRGPTLSSPSAAAYMRGVAPSKLGLSTSAWWMVGVGQGCVRKRSLQGAGQKGATRRKGVGQQTQASRWRSLRAGAARRCANLGVDEQLNDSYPAREASVWKPIKGGAVGTVE